MTKNSYPQQVDFIKSHSILGIVAPLPKKT